MTPSSVIAEVRVLIQDSSTPLRYSDVVLLGFVNDIVKRMIVFRPDLFATLGNIPTTAGTAVQSLPADGVRLVEIFQTVGGSAVTEVDRQTMDRMAPGWMSETPGSPVNFVRHPRNPRSFFLYPPPSTGTQMLAEYTATPADYALGDAITALPDAYFPQLVDGVVFLAESVDNEHINSGRAKLFLDAFAGALGVDLNSRNITDREDAAVIMPNQDKRSRGG